MTVKSMSESQKQRFIRHMEIQGVKVTPTKKGLFLRLPDGSSTVKHFTESDSRAENNLIGRLRRAGVTHPDDPRGSAVLPTYITEGTITPATRKRVLDWVIGQGVPEAVYSKDIVHDLNMDPGQANRALFHTGFRPGKAIKKKQGRPWLTPDDVLALRPDRVVDEEVEHVEDEVVEPELPEVVIPDDIQELQKAAEETERKLYSGIVDGARKAQEAINELGAGPKVSIADLIDPYYEEPVVHETPEPEDQGPATREFIDTVDSWSVDMKELLGEHLHRMVKDRLQVLEAVGLDYEVRVWRKQG